jgi:hypothetical protein
MISPTRPRSSVVPRLFGFYTDSRTIKIMKYLYLVLAVMIPLSQAQAGCPANYNVTFTDPKDVLFPPLDLSKNPHPQLTTEMFYFHDFGYDVKPDVMVRDANGGLHLAKTTSMVNSTSNQPIRLPSRDNCTGGDDDLVISLYAEYNKHEIAKQKPELAKNQIICQPEKETQVSVDDKVFASYNAQPARTGFIANLARLIPGHDNELPANTFVLIGEATVKANAPKEMQNMGCRPADDQRPPTPPGSYIIRDQNGKIHNVTTEELSSASQNKLKGMKFICAKPEPTVTDRLDKDPYEYLRQQKKMENGETISN